ncbi:MAG: tetratricopeptide repeat protein [Leptolyngbyaceae cyanobacterium]
MRRYHVRLMVSVLVSLSAVAWAGESGRVVMARSMVAQADAEALLEEGDRLYERGLQLFQGGQLDEALQSWQQALELYRDSRVRTTFPQRVRKWEGYTLGYLGNAYRALGEYQRSIDLLEESLTITREIRDRIGEGVTLGNLGVVYSILGQHLQAIDLFEQQLTLAREVDDLASEGAALGNLSIVYSDLEDILRLSTSLGSILLSLEILAIL